MPTETEHERPVPLERVSRAFVLLREPRAGPRRMRLELRLSKIRFTVEEATIV